MAEPAIQKSDKGDTIIDEGIDQGIARLTPER